jgi:hypothetical protein
MAKKPTTPAASRKTAPKAEAPMVVSRPTTNDTEIATKAIADVAIAHDEIAQLAYARYVERGYLDGHALEDWIAAESELRARRR